MTPVFLDAFLKVSSAMEEFPTCPPGFPSHLFLILYQSHCLSPMLLIMQLNCEASCQCSILLLQTSHLQICMHTGVGGRVGRFPCSRHLTANMKGSKEQWRRRGWPFKAAERRPSD